MRCSSLLTQARRCRTEDDVAELLSRFEEAFESTRPLAPLGRLSSNDECFLERGETPFVRFETAIQLSGHFVLRLCPELSEGALGVMVRLDYLQDGGGVQNPDSSAWAGCESFVRACRGESVSHLARRAKELALSFHAKLFESAGVPREKALQMASRVWPKAS